MNLEQETKNIMKKYHITANKSLGQNFLIKENVIEGIMAGAQIDKNDIVIEIGPGLGTLTKYLLEKAGKVLCVELDKRMIKILEDRFKENTNLEIINDDILKLDLREKINEELKQYKKAKIVANLPYYITTPIIMKLLEEKLNIESITVMVQKEVAERLTAQTGENLSGAITHTIHYYTKPQIILEVPKDSFIPAPEVESAVIKLDILKEPSVKVADEEKLFKIIKYAYMQRRKTLINSLSNMPGISKDNIEKALNKMGLDQKIRGEKITLEQYAKISEII